MFRANGHTFSTRDNTLQVVFVRQVHGRDIFGNFTDHQFDMKSKSNSTMKASIRNYYERQFLTFRQSFDSKLVGMSVKDKSKVTTAFPSVKVPPSSNSQYLHLCDDIGRIGGLRKGIWEVKNMTNLCAEKNTDLQGGLESGPLYIYDRATPNYYGQVFSISSFSKFTVHFTEVRDDYHFKQKN